MRKLSPQALAAIVEKDVTERGFMVSGDLTREVYDESCKFTDEIDTYTLEKYIQGIKALFEGPPKSTLALTSPVVATDDEVSFTFSEYLMFKVPFRPACKLTGRLVMKRGSDGLITSYREYWDGGVPATLLALRPTRFDPTEDAPYVLPAAGLALLF